MNKLSNVKLESVDKEKSKNGKGTASKKIHRKIVKKQMNVIGQLSTTVENAHLVYSKPKMQAKAQSKVLPKMQPQIQQKLLRAIKEPVKKSITQSITKKSSAQKVLAVTTKRTPTVKSQKPSRPIKKNPVTKDPNSSIIDRTEPKKKKLVKRVLKAIPTTTKPTATAIAMPRATATLHGLEGTNPTTPAKKQPAKRVKRVLKKKLESSLNGKITEPKVVGAMPFENVMPIENTTKPLIPTTTKQNNILNYNEYNIL
ncbi:probable serine/threonine-protein kinase nek3 [Melanaphis sacchari]|uniref:probable serine/threonine-protein kinase nek3 n=1 Tax=Melanaphis sacchari TaxID=742174 RepID=UPI000DC1386F|nr:probable serine/threonine-protein kinase nek3 [Melanaphis sacchari]XP_025199194.1 probable serine/threonine-protein kinase nek3 [Melanaphis sacchari]